MSRFNRTVRAASLWAILIPVVHLAGCSDRPTPTTAQPQSGFSISPAQLTLTAIADTGRITAMDIPAGATEAVQVGGVAWSSSDTAVATIDGEGLVTAVGDGTAMISGRSGLETDRTVVVVSQVPTRVDIQPSALTLSTLGASARLAAHAFDRTGHEIPATDVRWTSTDTTVVVVSTDGTITARRNGAAEILATVVGWPLSSRVIPAPGSPHP